MTISNAHPDAVKQSIAVLKNNGERGKAVAKRKAPVDTSFLKNHITTNYQGMEARLFRLPGVWHPFSTRDAVYASNDPGSSTAISGRYDKRNEGGF